MSASRTVLADTGSTASDVGVAVVADAVRRSPAGVLLPDTAD